jgi:hypothetical protein
VLDFPDEMDFSDTITIAEESPTKAFTKQENTEEKTKIASNNEN